MPILRFTALPKHLSDPGLIPANFRLGIAVPTHPHKVTIMPKPPKLKLLWMKIEPASAPPVQRHARCRLPLPRAGRGPDPKAKIQKRPRRRDGSRTNPRRGCR